MRLSHVGIITNEIPVGKSVEIEGELIATEFPDNHSI